MMEGGDAAEQVVRMMLSGGEITVRLAGSALKNGLAMLMALAKNNKKVFGKTSMIKMLKQTRDIRTFPMTQEQFKAFRKKAQKHKILYSAVQDRHKKDSLVDLILPVTEIDRANTIFEKIHFVPEGQEKNAPIKDEPERKKGSRSEPDSRATRDSSSMRSEKNRTTNERPSVEQRLKENKAALENNRHQAPTKQKTKSRSKGKAK